MYLILREIDFYNVGEKNMTKIDHLFWTTGVLAVLLSGAMMIMNLWEFYKTGILKQTSEYPFGGEGPVPYYYKTAEMYSGVMLVWGIVFFLTMAFAILTILKRQKSRTLMAFGLTLLLIIAMYIQGQIG
jgi:hypothetical protein